MYIIVNNIFNKKELFLTDQHTELYFLYMSKKYGLSDSYDVAILKKVFLYSRAPLTEMCVYI